MATYTERDRLVIARLCQIRVLMHENKLIAEDEAIKNIIGRWIKEIDTALTMINEDDGRDV
jgi:hypothetical protein